MEPSHRPYDVTKRPFRRGGKRNQDVGTALKERWLVARIDSFPALRGGPRRPHPGTGMAPAFIGLDGDAYQELPLSLYLDTTITHVHTLLARSAVSFPYSRTAEGSSPYAAADTKLGVS